MQWLVVALVAGVTIVLACAPSAAQTPAGESPAGTGTGPASAGDYRQQVIDAARAEGVVNATIHTSWSPEGIQHLEAAIEREYGVRIQIQYTPVGNYPQRASSLFSEIEAGATPSYDLYQSSDTTSA